MNFCLWFSFCFFFGEIIYFVEWNKNLKWVVLSTFNVNHSETWWIEVSCSIEIKKTHFKWIDWSAFVLLARFIVFVFDVVDNNWPSAFYVDSLFHIVLYKREGKKPNVIRWVSTNFDSFHPSIFQHEYSIYGYTLLILFLYNNHVTLLILIFMYSFSSFQDFDFDE